MAPPSATTALTEDDIAAVVDAFYAKVRADTLLGSVFRRAIADEAWPQHIVVIRDFWSSVMLKPGRYQRNPFSAHCASTASGRSCSIAGSPCFVKHATNFWPRTLRNRFMPKRS